ncbi:unnamed protein product [Pieris macdunnoughi]|uniref:Uncharacterized protein n=1 Tax=Pieris macdunnoughi TaxID=345717 RepID=A0A821UP95_9NEOP|nr:unnamed protein product [Pieris macdunnoughi]
MRGLWRQRLPSRGARGLVRFAALGLGPRAPRPLRWRLSRPTPTDRRQRVGRHENHSSSDIHCCSIRCTPIIAMYDEALSNVESLCILFSRNSRARC